MGESDPSVLKPPSDDEFHDASVKAVKSAIKLCAWCCGVQEASLGAAYAQSAAGLTSPVEASLPFHDWERDEQEDWEEDEDLEAEGPDMDSPQKWKDLLQHVRDSAAASLQATETTEAVETEGPKVDGLPAHGDKSLQATETTEAVETEGPKVDGLPAHGDKSLQATETTETVETEGPKVDGLPAHGDKSLQATETTETVETEGPNVDGLPAHGDKSLQVTETTETVETEGPNIDGLFAPGENEDRNEVSPDPAVDPWRSLVSLPDGLDLKDLCVMAGAEADANVPAPRLLCTLRQALGSCAGRSAEEVFDKIWRLLMFLRYWRGGMDQHWIRNPRALRKAASSMHWYRCLSAIVSLILAITSLDFPDFPLENHPLCLHISS